MTKIDLLISPDIPFVVYNIRLDMPVDPYLFMPVIKTSATKMIAITLKEYFNSLNYTFNSNINGIKVSIDTDSTIIQTNLSRDEALNLLEKLTNEGCHIKVHIEYPN